MVLKPIATRILGSGFVLLAGFLPIATYSTAFAQADSSTSKVLDARKDDVRVENIKDLNTKGDEATPFISPVDGSIYFTSTRDGKNIVYVSKRLPPGGPGDLTSHWAAPEVFSEMPAKQNVSSLSVAGDGVTAVFGACNRPDGILQSCDIYQGELSSGKLDNIVSLGRPVNSEWWEGQPSISQDGQLLFFASDRKGGHGGIDIYMSSKTADGRWSDPVNLSFNTSGDELSPMIARDNQTLYFAANKLPGGMGGYDIYMSKRVGQNDWTPPRNLGPSINSAKNELFFYLPPNEDAVYFASDREGGAGYFDLYRVYVQPAPPKAKLVTLTGRILDAETGQPIATRPELELSLSKTGEALPNAGSGASYSTTVLVGSLVKVSAGAEAYVSTVMELQAPSTNDPSTVTQDIRLTPSHARIVGHVTNAFSHNPLHTTVTLQQLGSNATPTTVMTDAATGAFAFNVNPLNTYQLSTEVENYEPYSKKVEIPQSREKMIEVQKEIPLQPSQIDNVMILFDFNKSDIKKEELSKLDRFIRQVKENTYVRIEVNGHTDDVGSDEYNAKLSERRAVTVEDYLLSRGVPRDQLAVVKGFGKSAPIAPGTTDEDRAKNRRVEVRIVAKQD